MGLAELGVLQASQHPGQLPHPAGLVTASGVTRLDQPARVRELSRMLAGLEDSEFGQAHAEELLAMAEGERDRDWPWDD